MAVRQSAQQVFSIDKTNMAQYVRNVLAGDPTYKSTNELGDSATFTTTVKPNIPLILGTAMTIRLSESGSQTAVSVTTESQSYIIGDAFGMYRKYIRDFFSALNKAVGQGEPSLGETESIIFKQTSWWSVAILVAALIALLLVAFVIYPSAQLPGFILWPCALILLLALIRAIGDLRRSE